MFKYLLTSLVIVPVLAGMVAGRSRRVQAALVGLIAFVLLYDVGYLMMLFYLRRRWIG
jgi:hypothetical protein